MDSNLRPCDWLLSSVGNKARKRIGTGAAPEFVNKEEAVSACVRLGL